jgi:hypothetical protein
MYRPQEEIRGTAADLATVLNAFFNGTAEMNANEDS